MEVTWRIPADRFLRQVDLLDDVEAEDALGAAVVHLESDPWDRRLPIRLIDAARNRYSYPFHPGHELVFRRLPLRGAKGEVVAIEIQLVALYRTV